MKLNRLSSLTIALFLALIFAAALLWLSANVAASTAGPILFSDDFEGGSANWTAIEGTWSVVLDGSHVYQQDDVSVTGRSVAGAPEWTDYVAQARIKPVSGKYAMLMVRYQDPNNYYLFALRTDNGKMEMKKMSNGSSGSALAGSRYIPITPGEWYTATFEAVGTTLRAFINGTPVMTYTDNAGTPPFMAGKIGLGTLDAVAEFDDVSVVSLVPVYPLRVTRAGTGDGSVSSLPAGIECSVTCTADFTAGTVVTLTAAPKPDSVFAGWIGAGCGNTDSCVVTMDAAKSVAAVFSALSQPTLIVNKDGTGSGSVTSSPVGIACGASCLAGFAQGVVVTLTATAEPFSAFSGWSGAGCSGADICVITMDTAKMVTATFTYVTHPLTVTKTGSGTGTVTSNPAGIACGPTCTASLGGVVTLTAVADIGSSFTRWNGAGCHGSGPCVLTMDAAKTITATFSRYNVYLPIVASTILTATAPPSYVAPWGDDANPGTLTQPFFTLTRAALAASPGQTITMRGGTYRYTDTVILDKNGNSVNLYKIWAYPGEQPVLDFSASPSGARGFLITGNFWHLKGLEIMKAQDNAIKIEGSYNIVEQCILHDNQDSGLQIGLATESTNPGGLLASHNQIINCDSYRNFDAATNGSNADGFACKLHAGQGNVFRGCRAWENADDGWDMFLQDYPVIIDSSWTWHNGDRTLFGSPIAWGGNGNGFKVGGGNNHGAHILRNCVAFDHKYGDGSATKGFDQNHNFSGVTIYNSTAWSNTINYSFYEQPDDGTPSRPEEQRRLRFGRQQCQFVGGHDPAEQQLDSAGHGQLRRFPQPRCEPGKSAPASRRQPARQ